MVAVRVDEKGVLVDEDDGEDDNQPSTRAINFYASPLRRARSIHHLVCINLA